MFIKNLLNFLLFYFKMRKKTVYILYIVFFIIFLSLFHFKFIYANSPSVRQNLNPPTTKVLIPLGKADRSTQLEVEFIKFFEGGETKGGKYVFLVTVPQRSNTDIQKDLYLCVNGNMNVIFPDGEQEFQNQLEGIRERISKLENGSLSDYAKEFEMKKELIKLKANLENNNISSLLKDNVSLKTQLKLNNPFTMNEEFKQTLSQFAQKNLKYCYYQIEKSIDKTAISYKGPESTPFITLKDKEEVKRTGIIEDKFKLNNDFKYIVIASLDYEKEKKETLKAFNFLNNKKILKLDVHFDLVYENNIIVSKPCYLSKDLVSNSNLYIKSYLIEDGFFDELKNDPKTKMQKIINKITKAKKNNLPHQSFKILETHLENMKSKQLDSVRIKVNERRNEKRDYDYYEVNKDVNVIIRSRPTLSEPYQLSPNQCLAEIQNELNELVKLKKKPTIFLFLEKPIYMFLEEQTHSSIHKLCILDVVSDVTDRGSSLLERNHKRWAKESEELKEKSKESLNEIKATANEVNEQLKQYVNGLPSNDNFFHNLGVDYSKLVNPIYEYYIPTPLKASIRVRERKNNNQIYN